MNEITLVSSHLQFKSPILGKPTYAIEAHYHARRVVAMVHGVERQFRFMSDELNFDSTEDAILEAVRTQMATG